MRGASATSVALFQLSPEPARRAGPPVKSRPSYRCVDLAPFGSAAKNSLNSRQAEAAAAA